jgi:hypothetical protein
MSKRENIITISGILTLLLTIFLFFWLTVDRPLLVCTGFGFILWAEIVLFGGLVFVEKISKRTFPIIFRSGVVTVLTTYSILSIIISLMAANKILFDLKSIWTLQAILTVISMILIMVFYQLAEGVRKSNNVVSGTATMVNDILGRINILKVDESNKEYAPMLNSIADKFYFSDTSTIVSADEEIEKQVTMLETALNQPESVDKTSISAIIENIDSLINRRKIEVGNTKRGSV